MAYARSRPAVANCWIPTTNLGLRGFRRALLSVSFLLFPLRLLFLSLIQKGRRKDEGGEVIVGFFSSLTESHRPSCLLTGDLICLSVKIKKIFDKIPSRKRIRPNKKILNKKTNLLQKNHSERSSKKENHPLDTKTFLPKFLLLGDRSQSPGRLRVNIGLLWDSYVYVIRGLLSAFAFKSPRLGKVRTPSSHGRSHHGHAAVIARSCRRTQPSSHTAVIARSCQRTHPSSHAAGIARSRHRMQTSEHAVVIAHSHRHTLLSSKSSRPAPPASGQNHLGPTDATGLRSTSTPPRQPNIVGGPIVI